MATVLSTPLTAGFRPPQVNGNARVGESDHALTPAPDLRTAEEWLIQISAGERVYEPGHPLYQAWLQWIWHPEIDEERDFCPHAVEGYCHVCGGSICPCCGRKVKGDRFHWHYHACARERGITECGREHGDGRSKIQ